ncbi:conserved hypothetical protein [Leishmania mexicana MHOM/GT/2001/U1103]|uniref:Uncharacterized protein n=1 Tax=Leishmania mexicana (strain MHOM/GT/2001/U1103) TaxID=929439 RepID=E9AP34_LEIMU|nr:conserved hypothetical protein [Leishmania mexicana MHOM/GT/2001/U1103]CBZ24698.1 conserved hypothetical protein [Leishmania mexicana MHOM/GT/2001/U1103]
MATPRHGELDSICSPSSSERSPRGCGQSSERLIDLLTRPSAQGGYGGRLNYTGFATLAASLGWNQEDMDDCWYDIVMGEPCAEAVDMKRVAECVCSYCLASPLPILEHSTLTKSSPAEPATPPRLPHASRERSTTVLLSPPTPPSRRTETVMPMPPKTGDKKGRTTATTSPRQASAQRRCTMPNVFPRYAVETMSSEQKKASVSPRRRSHTAQNRQTTINSSRPTSPAPTPSQTSGPSGGSVFSRLYEKGMEQHRKRIAVKPADSDVAECTFQPHITPYTPKASDTASMQYNKPTQSYFAKLTAQDSPQEAAGTSPETPRVTYQPAPGPSSDVPPGYVEGVARLRSYIASRYARPSFESSLRGSSSANVARLVEAPILRLPVTVGGVTDAVDVRLASPDARTSLGRECSVGPGRLYPRQRSEARHVSFPSPSRVRFRS